MPPTGISVLTQRQNISDCPLTKCAAIAEENAASTEETSASATEMSAIMESIDNNAKNLNEVAEQLHATISKFKI